MIPDYFSVINLENNFGIKKITKIQTIWDLLNVSSVGKSMFCEYTTLIRLYLTVRVTTATAERSFSATNRKLTAGGCGGLGVGLEPGIVIFHRKIGKSD
ncbi:unnamed protein product [Rotaria sp. Silwood2]|nr:unnamed protein product [Rotaria sp. Silwood2]